MNKPMMGFDGLYQLEKRTMLGVDAAGNQILSEPTVIAPWFGNLITDAGLDLLGSSTADNLAYCRFGTGTTAPADTDTVLAAQAGYSNTAGDINASGVAVDSTYLYRRVSRRFAAGSVDGMALAELGMAATSTGDLFSRTLIKDAAGTPITITLSPDEVLDVVYEVRAYIDMADDTVAATIDGAANTVTIRKHGTLGNTAWLKFAANLGCGLWYYFDGSNRHTAYCAEAQPSAATVPNWVGAGYLTPARSYTAGTYQLTLTFAIGLAEQNFTTGIGALLLSTADLGAAANNGAWSWGFSPKLNKTASRIANITVGLSWGRYTIPGA